MRFGFRIPSLRKRLAARTSLRRAIRHSLGLKAPRGYGWITNPRRAAYNRVYARTTHGCALILLAGAIVATASALIARPGLAQQAMTAGQVDSIARAATRSAFEFQESVAASTRRRLADSLYMASLERSIPRAALDETAIGAAVGALGVLFAIGAIVAGFLLFRQSSDYRNQLAAQSIAHDKRLDETVANYQEILNGFITAAKADIEAAKANLERDREELKKRGEADSAEWKRRTAELERLSAREATLQSVQTMTPAYPNLGIGESLSRWRQFSLAVAASLRNTLTDIFKAIQAWSGQTESSSV